MEYVDGGASAEEFVWNVLAGLVACVIFEGAKALCTGGALKAAIIAAGAAGKVVLSAVASAVAFVWNTPVLLASLSVAVGVGGTLFVLHGRKKGWF